MGGKITFELGPAAIALIAVAAIVGYVIGSSYPFGGKGSSNERLVPDQETAALGLTEVTPVGYDKEDIKNWSSEIGLDADQFNTCFDSQKYLDQIQSDFQDGMDLGFAGTPSFLIGTKDKGFVAVVGAQPYDILKTVIDSYLNGTSPKAEFNLTDPIGNAPVIGNRDAEVLIIEFSDFQCPFCRLFYTQTLPQIEGEYINTGKVALVYKDFPLTSIHPGAVDYGLAAKCAQEQGKWREMHDKIFDEQNKLGVSTIPYG